MRDRATKRQKTHVGKMWTVVTKIPRFIEAKANKRVWTLASALALSCIAWAWFDLTTSHEREAKLHEKVFQLAQIRKEMERAPDYFGTTAQAALAYQEVDNHFHATFGDRSLGEGVRKQRVREGLELIARKKLNFSEYITMVHRLPTASGRLANVKTTLEETLANIKETLLRMEEIYKLANSDAPISPQEALAAIDAHIAQFNVTFTDGEALAQQLTRQVTTEELRQRAEEDQLVADFRMLRISRYVTYAASSYLVLYLVLQRTLNMVSCCLLPITAGGPHERASGTGACAGADPAGH